MTPIQNLRLQIFGIDSYKDVIPIQKMIDTNVGWVEERRRQRRLPAG
jgi:hypothetical protein